MIVPKSVKLSLYETKVWNTKTSNPIKSTCLGILQKCFSVLVIHMR